MVTVVVIINTLIALFNFYLAWRIWKLRRRIAKAAIIINKADRRIYNVLHAAPSAISKGQKAGAALSDRYRQLALQTQRLQQVLALVYLGKKLWYDRTYKPGQSSSHKKRPKIKFN